MSNTEKYKRNTAVVTISLTQEQLDKLDRIAAEAGRTRSNAVARWIEAAKDPK